MKPLNSISYAFQYRLHNYLWYITSDIITQAIPPMPSENDPVYTWLQVQSLISIKKWQKRPLTTIFCRHISGYMHYQYTNKCKNGRDLTPSLKVLNMVFFKYKEMIRRITIRNWKWTIFEQEETCNKNDNPTKRQPKHVPAEDTCKRYQTSALELSLIP